MKGLLNGVLDELTIILPSEVDENETRLCGVGSRDQDRVEAVKVIILLYEGSLCLSGDIHGVEPAEALERDRRGKGGIPSGGFEIREADAVHAVDRVVRAGVAQGGGPEHV